MVWKSNFDCFDGAKLEHQSGASATGHLPHKLYPATGTVRGQVSRYHSAAALGKKDIVEIKQRHNVCS